MIHIPATGMLRAKASFSNCWKLFFFWRWVFFPFFFAKYLFVIVIHKLLPVRKPARHVWYDISYCDCDILGSGESTNSSMPCVRIPSFVRCCNCLCLYKYILVVKVGYCIMYHHDLSFLNRGTMEWKQFSYWHLFWFDSEFLQGHLSLVFQFLCDANGITRSWMRISNL